LSALDVTFWGCAFVALVCSAALAAIGLYAWQPSWTPTVRSGPAGAPRHFGRTSGVGKWGRWALALRQ